MKRMTLAVIATLGLASLLLLQLAFGQNPAGPSPHTERESILALDKLMVEPMPAGEITPLPIGRGGDTMGFAFAPGRAELAYCALEDRAGTLVSVLRIVQVPMLWFPNVPNAIIHEFSPTGRYITRLSEAKVPFSARERELLSLPLSIDSATPPTTLVGPIRWSPNGEKLAVCTTTDDPNNIRERSLLIVDYGTGKYWEAGASIAPDSIAWSPDSHWLAFTKIVLVNVTPNTHKSASPLAAQLTRAGLWLADVANQKTAQIDKTGMDPSWSVDGKQLRYTVSGITSDKKITRTGKSYDIASAKTVAAKPVNLTYPLWAISPNGRFNALCDDVGAKASGLIIREVASGSAQLKLANVRDIGGWSPDSKLLAFVNGEGWPAVTVLSGPHAGRRLVLNKDKVSSLPGQPALDWSAPLSASSLPTWMRSNNPQEIGGVSISWVAYISNGALMTVPILRRPRTSAEAARLGESVSSGTGTRMSKAEEIQATNNNMKQIMLALQLYASDWNSHLPLDISPTGIATTLNPYTVNPTVFARPGQPNKPVIQYIAPPGICLDDIPDPASYPVAIFDFWSDGVIVGFANGRSQWCTRRELNELLRALTRP
jgi:hypothetical protein